MKHVSVVLEILDKHRLYANKKKCHLMVYLGHVISRSEVSLDISKVQSIAL